MASKDHSKAFGLLIETAGITQEKAARILLEQSYEALTKKNLMAMERRVRSWLANPGTEKKAKCPGWAVRLLEIGLKEMER